MRPLGLEACDLCVQRTPLRHQRGQLRLAAKCAPWILRSKQHHPCNPGSFTSESTHHGRVHGGRGRVRCATYLLIMHGTRRRKGYRPTRRHAAIALLDARPDVRMGERDRWWNGSGRRKARDRVWCGSWTVGGETRLEGCTLGVRLELLVSSTAPQPLTRSNSGAVLHTSSVRIHVRRRAWRRRLPCDSMRRRRACASGSRSGDGTRRLGVCRAGEWAHGGGDLGSRDLSPTQGERVLQCARTCDRATASRPCAHTSVQYAVTPVYCEALHRAQRSRQRPLGLSCCGCLSSAVGPVHIRLAASGYLLSESRVYAYSVLVRASAPRPHLLTGSYSQTRLREGTCVQLSLLMFALSITCCQRLHLASFYITNSKRTHTAACK